MAYPQVAAYNEGTTARDTTHAINMPGGISAGNLLIVIFATDGDNTIANWDGFTELFSTSNGSASSLHIGYKIAVGSDTLTITTNQNEEGSYVIYRITGHGSASDPPEVSAGATGDNDSPDPDQLTMATSKEYLWIACEGSDHLDVVTAYPTTHPDNTHTQNGGGSGSCGVGVASREYTGTSDDPGVFTLQNGEEWVACTVAVYPVSGATLERFASDSLDISETVIPETIRLLERFASDSIDISENLWTYRAPRTDERFVSDSIDISDDPYRELIRIIERYASDGLDITETPDRFRGFARVVADGVDITENIYREIIRVILREASDGVDITDEAYRELIKIITKEVSDSIDIDDVATRSIIRIILKEVSDSIDITDTPYLERVLERYVSDGVDISESVFREIIILPPVERFASDGIDISDSVSREILRVFERGASDSIDISDSVARELIKIIEREVSDNVEITDTAIQEIVRLITRVADDSIDITENVYREVERTYERFVSDSIDITDDPWREISVGLIYERYVSDDIDVGDGVWRYIPQTFERFASDAIEISDTLYQDWFPAKLIPDYPTTNLYLQFGLGTIISQEDISTLETKYAMNEIPTAKYLLSNKNGKYTTGSNETDGGNPVILSGSTDGGDTWHRIFSGSTYKKSSNLSANGQETVNILIRDDRLLGNIDCNKGVQKQKDLGAIFTGTTTTTDGTIWSSDPQGNYPDGLLHRTGLTFSSTYTDVFDGVLDIPDEIVLGHETVFSAMGRFTDIFALQFCIDSTTSAFYLYDANADFPERHNTTLSYGQHINQSNITWDFKDHADAVVVWGEAPLFYQSGSGDNVRYVRDDEITNYEEAKAIASQYYEQTTGTVVMGNIKTPGIMENVVGKRIAVDDDTHGWSGMGDVAGVRHNITAERWTSRLTFDEPAYTIEKTMAEVMEDIDKIKDDKMYSDVFDCFRYIRYDDSDVFHSTDDISSFDVCGFGLGTDSTDTNSTDSQNIVQLIPRRTAIGDVHYGFLNTRLKENFEFDEENVVIGEIVAYGNTNSGDPILVSGSEKIVERPTTSADWGSYTHPGWQYPMGKGTIGLQQIYFNGVYTTPRDMDVVGVAWTQTTQPQDLKFFKATSSLWRDTARTHFLSRGEKENISWDGYDKTPSQVFSYTRSVGANKEAFCIRFRMPTSITREEQYQDFDVGMNFVVTGTWVADTDSSTQSTWVGGDDGVGYETLLGMGPHRNSTDSADWTFQLGRHTGYPPVITEDGFINFYILPYHPSHGRDVLIKPNTAVTISVAFVETYVKQTGGGDYTVERAKLSDGGRKLNVSKKIDWLWGLYSTSDASGKELLSYKTEKLGNIVDINWKGMMHIPGKAISLLDVPIYQETFRMRIDEPDRKTITKDATERTWQDWLGLWQVDNIYVKYRTHERDIWYDDRFVEGKGYIISSSKKPETEADTLLWLHMTDSTSDEIPYLKYMKPPYGLGGDANYDDTEYSIYYYMLDPRPIARWTSEPFDTHTPAKKPPIDKTRNKTLTLAYVASTS